jgi:hypothetical protein
MTTEADPLVGQWYQYLDKGQRFKVNALDESGGFIEIQYFDGDIEEITEETWYISDIEPISIPEDWTGPLDDIEYDDLDYSATEMSPDDWASPLKENASQADAWEQSSETDDWGEGLSEEEPLDDDRP